MLYEGEISLHFDPPSRHSHRTQSPLLWAVIRILYLDTARFIDRLGLLLGTTAIGISQLYSTTLTLPATAQDNTPFQLITDLLRIPLRTGCCH